MVNGYPTENRVFGILSVRNWPSFSPFFKLTIFLHKGLISQIWIVGYSQMFTYYMESDFSTYTLKMNPTRILGTLTQLITRSTQASSTLSKCGVTNEKAFDIVKRWWVYFRTKNVLRCLHFLFRHFFTNFFRENTILTNTQKDIHACKSKKKTKSDDG